MECPKCGMKKLHKINAAQYAAAVAAATAAAATVMPFNKILARSIMKSVCEKMCPTIEYICLNPECKHMFTIKNNF